MLLSSFHQSEWVLASDAVFNSQYTSMAVDRPQLKKMYDLSKFLEVGTQKWSLIFKPKNKYPEGIAYKILSNWGSVICVIDMKKFERS